MAHKTLLPPVPVTDPVMRQVIQDLYDKIASLQEAVEKFTVTQKSPGVYQVEVQTKHGTSVIATTAKEKGI